MRISLIVALAENGVIGRNRDLPWRLSADLRRFKKLTMGHHIVMGRRTFESIGRLLPGRTTVVVTRQKNYHFEGARIADSVAAAIRLAADDSEVFICGGAEIYRAAIGNVDRIYVTRVHAQVEGDTAFPELDWSTWRQTDDCRYLADDKNEFDYSFQIYERIND